MFRSVSRLAARRWQPKGKAKNVADSDPGAHLRPVPKVAPHEVVPTAPSVKDGRERSAIFGNYPTRQKLNYKAAKVKPDRNAAWRLDPVCELPLLPLFTLTCSGDGSFANTTVLSIATAHANR